MSARSLLKTFKTYFNTNINFSIFLTYNLKFFPKNYTELYCNR